MGYNFTWKNTSDNLKFTIANGNNFDGAWDYVRFGTKKGDSTGTITTDSPFAEAIAESAITIDKVTIASIDSIKLFVSTSADFKTNTTSYNVNVAEGKQITKITTPVANAYYKYEIKCKKASKNGIIQISKITFTTVAE